MSLGPGAFNVLHSVNLCWLCS